MSEETSEPSKAESRVRQAIATQLRINENIGPHAMCTHPLATVHLELKDRTPIFRKQYPLSEDHQEAVQAQVQEWLENGYIEPATPFCKWNFPLLAVDKKPDPAPLEAQSAPSKPKKRVCMDLRALNQRLQDNGFQMPRIEDIVSSLARFQFFAKLDLSNAYLQLRLAQSDRDVLTFSVPNGHHIVRFRLTRAIFGLLFMSSHFQELMTRIFGDMLNVFIYIDDVIIGAHSIEEMIHSLREVFNRLNRFNLRVKLPKCVFLRSSLTVLGHVVSHNSVSMDPEKAKALSDWPLPRTVNEVASFVGAFTFVRPFIVLASDVVAPLDQLKSMTCDQAATLLQSPDFARLFNYIKRSVAHAVTLHPFNRHRDIILVTDASRIGVAAAIFQGSSLDEAQLIAVANRRLLRYEQNYTVLKLELLAIVFALRHFRRFLYGNFFHLFTDHRALRFMLDTMSTSPNPTLNAWFDLLMDFRFDVTHLPGALNSFVDALSRRPDFADANLSTQAAPAIALHAQPVNDLVPDKLRIEVHNAHLRGHLGVQLITKDLSSRLRLDRSVVEPVAREEVDKCETCTRFNAVRAGFHPLSSSHAESPGQCLQVDLLTGLPQTPRGNTVLFVAVDAFSSYLYLQALPDKSANSTAAALINYCALFGVPTTIVHDEGRDFSNAFWSAISHQLHITWRPTIPYTSRRQGKVERHNGIVLDMIRKTLRGNNTNWDLILGEVTCFANSRISSSTNSSPFALMFGRPPWPTEEKSDKPWAEVQATIQRKIYPDIKLVSEVQSSRRNASFARSHKIVSNSLPNGTRVMILDNLRDNKLAPRFVGDYTILQRMSNGGYVLQDSDGTLLNRLVDISHIRVSRMGAKRSERSFTIDRILDARGPKDSREYHILWDDGSDTWEPVHNFVDLAIVDEFEEERARQAASTPPAHDKRPLDAAEPEPAPTKKARRRKRKH